MAIVKRSIFAAFRDFLTKETCPNCSRSGGVAKNRTNEHDQKVPETVEREATRFDAKGKPIGSTKRQVQVQVLTAAFDQHYQCYLCGNQWTERRLEKIRPV